MQPINVVGAGFSGLASAYFLTKAGRQVRLFEKSDRAGGLIRTIRTEHGLVETAANGLLNSERLEAMCSDIGVPLLPTLRDGRRRFIYRGKPRQLPLRVSELARVGFGLVKNVASLRPHPLESISAWSDRVLGKSATNYLLSPALGGIYAGDPKRMSASLIFGRADLPEHLQTTRPVKGKLRGTVAPPNGMQQLIDGLRDYLKNAGVEFYFNHESPKPADKTTIVCLSARGAAQYLAESAPEISAKLDQVEMLSLLTATCFYGAGAAGLKGFGCLFPSDQGFRARGVLFNDCIFDGRGPAHSETWIFGGALNPDIVTLSDDELSEVISRDRERFFGKVDHPVQTQMTRWPKALPHYSLELERILTTLPPPPRNIFLVGNYLGRIGLAKILERAAYVVNEIVKTRP
jgi:oxygen-dependent protoporphyrinogen oxidase